MDFKLPDAIAVLERTPQTLRAMLAGLSPAWTDATEGGDSWSAYTIVGHLNHGERTDWIARAEIILAQGPDRRFTPYDRFAQFHESQGKSLAQLLDEFTALRTANVATLVLVIVGGLLYTLGAVIYGMKRPNPVPGVFGFHEIFHSLTVVAFLCHWTACLLVVLDPVYLR